MEAQFIIPQSDPRWRRWTQSCSTCPFCGALRPPDSVACPACDAESGDNTGLLAQDTDVSAENCRLYRQVSALARQAERDAAWWDALDRARAETQQILEHLVALSDDLALYTSQMGNALAFAHDAFHDALDLLSAGPPAAVGAEEKLREKAFIGARNLCRAIQLGQRRSTSMGWTPAREAAV